MANDFNIKNDNSIGFTPALNRVLEICVDDIEGAQISQAGGADRIELCSALPLGGLTPSMGHFLYSLQSAPLIEVVTIIRARHGSFVFQSSEKATMLNDIALFVSAAKDLDRIFAHTHLNIDAGSNYPNSKTILPAQQRIGFATGAITRQNKIDKSFMQDAVAAAAGAPVTCHRAFDQCDDLPQALEDLHACGVKRVLSGGGSSSAGNNRLLLKQLVQQAKDLGMHLVACGGLRPPQPHESDNSLVDILEQCHATQVHLRAPILASLVNGDSPQNDYDDGTLEVTDLEIVKRAAQIVHGI